MTSTMHLIRHLLESCRFWRVATQKYGAIELAYFINRAQLEDVKPLKQFGSLECCFLFVCVYLNLLVVFTFHRRLVRCWFRLACAWTRLHSDLCPVAPSVAITPTAGAMKPSPTFLHTNPTIHIIIAIHSIDYTVCSFSATVTSLVIRIIQNWVHLILH